MAARAVKTLYMPPRSLFWRGRLRAPIVPRATYRGVDSVRYGLHYGGPAGGTAFTREVFLASQAWNAPAGVTSIDVLCVGGGASPGSVIGAGGFLGWAGAGGGGGSVLVVAGITVVPLFVYDIGVGAGAVISGPANPGIAGNPSFFREGFAPFAFYAQSGLAGFGGGGDSDVAANADGGAGTANAAAGGGGSVTAGSVGGAGGGGAFMVAPATPQGTGGAGAGGAGNGADSTNVSGGGDPLQETMGGGGGAGGNGSGGDGGIGLIPPDHSFGAWGIDIGENGFFGGGGWGGQPLDFFAAPFFAPGNAGTGNGADNTGGGSGVDADNVQQPGRSGIVVVVYATP